MTIKIPSEWTDLDNVRHVVCQNDQGLIIYKVEVILPIVNKAVYVVNGLSPFDIEISVFERFGKDAKAKLAKIARLEYHRYCRPKKGNK